MVKRVSDSILMPTAERVGRTLGRIVNTVDKMKSIRKKAKPATRPKTGPTKASKKDSAVAAKRAEVRESWRAQEHDASAAVKAQHGTSVDERALARVTDGQRWTARKTH